MTETILRATGLASTRRQGTTLFVYAAALFVSATLVFSVQPLAARMILPTLGGSPGVWNTTMVFFQSALLLGYLYAHVLVTHVPPRWQAMVHMGLIALGAAFVPFAIDASGLSFESPNLGVLVLLAGALGLPFVALSANAPLLQSWFSRTGHRDAADPYFLYGASNLGSVLALLSYPVLIEPFLSLREQTLWWGAGYVAFAILLYLAHGFVAARPSEAIAPAHDASSPARPAPPVDWRLRLRWIAAAAVPSSLILGVTTHLSTNVAAAPFLWVVPLVLYLLTFMLVFERRGGLPWRPVATAQVALTAFVLLLEPYLDVIGDGVDAGLWLTVVLHLALFFLATLVCHGDLARHRPVAEKLTGFYFCMSLGGVIGGATTALLAPVMFSTVVEYPLLLAAACLFAPGMAGAGRTNAATWHRALFAVGVVGAIGLGLLATGGPSPTISLLASIAVAWLVIASRGRVARVALAATAALVLHLGLEARLRGEADDVLLRERSFYGQHAVMEERDGELTVRSYMHGDTIHNIQVVNAEHRRQPLAYYAPEGTFADVLRATRQRVAHPRVAAVGLGAGALACHVLPGERWTFFEIDAAVIRLARDPDLFTYVSDCAPDARMVEGDARLTIADEPDHGFDVILLDAFSSDSVPSHLLTTEALNLYRSKLAEGGVLMVHTSNRYTDVSSVALAGAAAVGWSARFGEFDPKRLPAGDPLARFKAASQAVVMGPAASVEGVDGLSGWHAARPHPLVRAWTDDFSNVVSALIAGRLGGPVAE